MIFGHCEGIKRLGRQTQTDLEEQADYNELTKIDQLFGVVRFQYSLSPDKCEDDHTCDQAGEGDKKGPTSQLVPHTDDKKKNRINQPVRAPDLLKSEELK